ncbi:uncharacterized protein A4U43_C08F34170 [Asparagus officinalis]|nr:uncharacterized protein A4U43_C08F34170 [Asparagus officinalis]
MIPVASSPSKTCIAAQQRDLHRLLTDNQTLAATHIALKQDLAASHRDLRLVADSAARVKVEGDAQVRGVYERLTQDRDEMMERVEKLKKEVEKGRGEAGKIQELKWEIEFMKSEIVRGRAAIEYEKKAHAVNLEQSQAMEKNMISMAREVEKLRAELANAEKRARAAAAAANPGAAYAESYARNDMAYGGNTYAAVYGFHQAQSGAAAGGSQYGLQYGSGAVPLGSYDTQQTHLHR